MLYATDYFARPCVCVCVRACVRACSRYRTHRADDSQGQQAVAELPGAKSLPLSGLTAAAAAAATAAARRAEEKLLIRAFAARLKEGSALLVDRHPAHAAATAVSSNPNHLTISPRQFPSPVIWGTPVSRVCLCPGVLVSWCPDCVSGGPCRFDEPLASFAVFSKAMIFAAHRPSCSKCGRMWRAEGSEYRGAQLPSCNLMDLPPRAPSCCLVRFTTRPLVSIKCRPPRAAVSLAR
jgi:hypothetical protein